MHKLNTAVSNEKKYTPLKDRRLSLSFPGASLQDQRPFQSYLATLHHRAVRHRPAGSVRRTPCAVLVPVQEWQGKAGVAGFPNGPSTSGKSEPDKHKKVLTGGER